MNPKVLVIGESNLDLVLYERSGIVPKMGREILLDDYVLTLGSSSAIFVCGFAKLSGVPIFVSKVGNDNFGRFYISELKRKGVDTSFIRVVDDLKTGLTVSLSGPSDRALVTFLGSIGEITYEDIPTNVFSKASHLHMAAFFLQKKLKPSFHKIFRSAKQMGLTTSFDPGCDPAGNWDVGEAAKYVDILFLNEVEKEAIDFGALPKPPILVVKYGAKGAAMIRNGKAYRAKPPHGVKVVETTGAGDSFDAAFVYGFLKRFSPDYLLRFACVAGTLSTRGMGGTGSQATVEEVKHFL